MHPVVKAARASDVIGSYDVTQGVCIHSLASLDVLFVIFMEQVVSL